MTKKDYILIADALVHSFDYAVQTHRDSKEAREMFLNIEETLSRKLHNDNPSFRPVTFHEYVAKRIVRG